MSSLIQTLLEIQQREGWLSDEALRALSAELDVPLHRLEGLTTFYTHFRRSPPRGARLEICRDLSCELAGGREICERLKSQSTSEQEVEIVEVSCLGRCDQAPAASIRGETLNTRDLRNVNDALAQASSAEELPPRLWESMQLYSTPAESYGTLREHARS